MEADPMKERLQTAATDCGIAVGGVAIALVVRQLLDRWLHDQQPFSTFYFAVFFAAWFGGIVPATLALLLAALAGDYFFIARRHSLLMHDFNDISRMIVFVAVGCCAIGFSQAQRVAQQRAEGAMLRAKRRQEALEREVAERRAAERSLHISEERFRRLRDANLLGIVSVNLDGYVEQANDEFLRMIGFIDDITTAEQGRAAFEAAKLTVKDLSITDEPTAEDLTALEQLSKVGACPAFERELLHRNRKTRVPVLIGAARHRSDHSGTIAFVLDRTASQQARQMLQMQSRVLESMVEGVIVAETGSGAIAYTNHSLDEMLGYSRGELNQADVASLSAIDESARSELDEEIGLSLRVRGSWSGELRYRRRDGSELICSAMVSAMRSGDRDYRIYVQQDAAAKHNAERAVEEAEQRLAMAMSAASLGTWEFDPAADLVNVSSPLLALKSDEPHAAMSINEIYELLHPDDRERVQQAMASALNGDSDYEAEFRGIRSDGTVRWFSARGKVFRDASGLPQRMTGVTLDVTERYEAERVLRVTEERFRLAVEAVEAVIYDWDVKSDTTFRSSGITKLLGFTPAEASADGAWWPARIHPDDAPAAIQHLTDKLADPHATAYESEYRIEHRDGRWVHVWDCGIIVRDADGMAIRVVGSAMDISDRKHAERELRDSEERFRQFADNTREVLWIYNARDNHLEYISPAYEGVWGRSRVTLLGRDDTWMETIYPDDRTRADQSVARAIADGESSVEYRVLRPDGSMRWVHDRGFAIRDDEGHVVRVAGIARDITESKASQEQVRLAKDTAEAADRAKDHFLAALSHELRTPLTPVLAVVQMMRSDATLSPAMRNDLDMICRNIELEARLIDDLLDLTRVARGKIDLQLAACEPDVLVRRAVEICRAEAADNKVDVTLELNAGPACQVNADAARLQQIAWNLVKNAIKFTPADRNGQRGSVTIRSACVADGQTFELIVSDNGIGIEPELRERIFNAFEQGAPDITRRFGGLGLGLTISKTLVDLHGGTLEAYSDGTNAGSTFTLRLPCRQLQIQAEQKLTDPASNETAIAMGDHRPAEAEPKKRLRVLLVEDHDDTAKVVARVLIQDGFDVMTAATRGEALQLAAEHEFDLIVSDIGLPDGSGLNLMQELSTRPNRPLKGIALSGFGMERDLQRSLEAGFIEHLTKPVDVSRLEAAIRRVANSE